MNLVRAAYLVWRSRKPGAVDVSMSRYGGPFTIEEQEFLANVSRAQAVDAELKLLTRKLPMLQANLARAERELAECQQKIERTRSEHNQLVGRTEQKQLMEAPCQLIESR